MNMLKKEIIESVGFDLDETLYPSNPEINDLIRNYMAKAISEKIKVDLSQARKLFDAEYSRLASGSKVLVTFGYTDNQANEITDLAAAQDGILPLIRPDPTTARIVKDMHGRYHTFLITSSPQKVAYDKLKALGISPTHFHERIFGDEGYGHKQDCKAFQEIMLRTGKGSASHVYIGNSRKADILPANKVGMQTIAAWSNIPEADLSIRHIHDLEGVLI